MVYFQVANLEPPIRAAGLEFRQTGREDSSAGSIRARDAAAPDLIEGTFGAGTVAVAVAGSGSP